MEVLEQVIKGSYSNNWIKFSLDIDQRTQSGYLAELQIKDIFSKFHELKMKFQYYILRESNKPIDLVILEHTRAIQWKRFPMNWRCSKPK